LQLHAYTQASKTNLNQPNDILLLRVSFKNLEHSNELIYLFCVKRENELLRERLSKYEGTQISSNSSTISNGSHPNQQQDSIVGDSDDLDSNVSSQSTSSVVAHETTIEQPKYFDRKRRLLAAEQQISPPEIDLLTTRKCSPQKKACLDEIVDSLNQKAQAEREEEDEQEEGEIEIHQIKQEQNEVDEEVEIIVETNNNLTPPSTTTTERENEDEDIDIDDAKLTVDVDH
jgi:hypothetical protein